MYAYYYEQYAAYQADPEAYAAQYAEYEQAQAAAAQAAAAEGEQPSGADDDDRRPDWLRELASKSQRRDEPAAEPEPEQQVGPNGRVWDERWGYARPYDGGKGGGKGGGRGGAFAGGRGGGGRGPPYVAGGPASGPPKRGYKLQRCPKWGQNLKCKKGWHCPFAHGDHELAPKEVRQRVRQSQEEKQAGKKGGWYQEGDNDQGGGRQREVQEDDNGLEPRYDDYESLVPQQPPVAPPAQPPPAAAAAPAAEGCVATKTDAVDHRLDGTPMAFSSRDAKSEKQRQDRNEVIYQAEQQAWGLDPTAGTSASASRTAATPAVAAGRGREAVKPAWMTRQQRSGASAGHGVAVGSATAGHGFGDQVPSGGGGGYGGYGGYGGQVPGGGGYGGYGGYGR